MKFLSLEHVLILHDKVLELSGGLEGTKNLGQLESVIENIKNDKYYESFTDKLTHLMYSLIKFHCFNDGNKRTAISCTIAFMNINGISKETCSIFFIMGEYLAVLVAENKISKETLAYIISQTLERDKK